MEILQQHYLSLVLITIGIGIAFLFYDKKTAGYASIMSAGLILFSQINLAETQEIAIILFALAGLFMLIKRKNINVGSFLVIVIGSAFIGNLVLLAYIEYVPKFGLQKHLYYFLLAAALNVAYIALVMKRQTILKKIGYKYYYHDRLEYENIYLLVYWIAAGLYLISALFQILLINGIVDSNWFYKIYAANINYYLVFPEMAYYLLITAIAIIGWFTESKIYAEQKK